MSGEWSVGHGQQIFTLYAWIATQPDGGEIVVTNSDFKPLISPSRQFLERWRPIAVEAQRASGCPVRLKMYAAGVIIDTIG